MNPEDIDQLAYAVLKHAHSTVEPLEIVAEVEAQIDSHEAARQHLSDSMGEDLARKKREAT